jgi:hypothetical protein
MTPCNRIKREIILQAVKHGHFELEEPLDTDDAVEAAYDDLQGVVEVGDYESEFRGGQVKTGLPCEWSRHYESVSVAARMSDGVWIGWTYWYGGGKHGEPEAIDWMSDAYELTCMEEEKVVTVRTFTKVETPGGGES